MPATADDAVPDLSVPRRIHVVNVGGAGMSGVATILAQMGHRVSGVDHNETPFLPPLRDLGVQVAVGAAGLDEPPVADLVVMSTATPDDHPDVLGAERAGVPVVHRRDALAAICTRRETVAVSGTHGKTTTSAMAATILDAVGDGAGFLVATRITGLDRSADWRTGPGFVIEADESDATFLRLGARDVVVTNVEADHLSFWGTEEALVEGFQQFVGGLDGTAVLCRDDAGSKALVAHATRSLTYGTDPAADLVIESVEAHGLGVRFVLHADVGSTVVEVPAAPGVHNARNAAAAIGVALLRGVELEAAAEGLRRFEGVARRFEHRGVAGGVTFVDSYDHLPTEIRAALAAARAAGFERVVCVFQPHRYTRTRDLAPTFADAFVDADVLAVTELYTAGEAAIPGVSGRLVHDAVVAAHPDADAHFVGDLESTEQWLLETLRPGDLCLTLNAGDLTRLPDRLVAALEGR